MARTANFNGYVQPNIAPVNAESVFEGNLGPLVVDNPSSYGNLYGALQDHGSRQAHAIAEVLVRAADIAGTVMPHRLWLPSHAECFDSGRTDLVVEEQGISFVALQKTAAQITKRGTGTIPLLLPHTLGLIINTTESPAARVRTIAEGRPVDQKALIFSGRTIRR